ncbi:MAG: hypothetical protein IPO21_02935 [Bacteroidales bacterium]|nr:hypothetical protein [Bacteroidales bacterium]
MNVQLLNNSLGTTSIDKIEIEGFSYTSIIEPKLPYKLNGNQTEISLF